MSNAASLRFECNACKKSYVFKPELANKKVKCKCGAVMTVPDLSSQAEEDMYDIAEEPKAAPVAKPIRAAVSAAAAAGAVAPTTRGGKPTIPYRSGPTAREKARASQDSIYDYKRDFYVPAALIAVSFVILFACTMTNFIRVASPFVYAIVFTIYALINAAVMLGGALFIGGKVGISFGEPLTAILKFIGIAFFVGIVTTVIDKQFGMLGMFVLSFFASAVLYTGLFVYLFSMDAEDSIWMVCFFIGVRTCLSWLLLPILLGLLAGGVGVGASMGGNSAYAAQQALASRIEENKDIGLVDEAREFIKAGRQTSWIDVVNKSYDAGATYIGFEVVRDMNGKPDAYGLVFKMPEEPEKRAAILKIINDDRANRKDMHGNVKPPMVDPGGEYIEVEFGSVF